MRHAGTSVTEYKCDTLIVPSPIKLTTTPLYAVTTTLLAKHLTELIKVSIFSAPQAKKNGGMNKAPQAIQCACGAIFLQSLDATRYFARRLLH